MIETFGELSIECAWFYFKIADIHVMLIEDNQDILGGPPAPPKETTLTKTLNQVENDAEEKKGSDSDEEDNFDQFKYAWENFEIA